MRSQFVNDIALLFDFFTRLRDDTDENNRRARRGPDAASAPTHNGRRDIGRRARIAYRFQLGGLALELLAQLGGVQLLHKQSAIARAAEQTAGHSGAVDLRAPTFAARSATARRHRAGHTAAAVRRNIRRGCDAPAVRRPPPPPPSPPPQQRCRRRRTTYLQRLFRRHDSRAGGRGPVDDNENDEICPTETRFLNQPSDATRPTGKHEADEEKRHLNDNDARSLKSNRETTKRTTGRDEDATSCSCSSAPHRTAPRRTTMPSHHRLKRAECPSTVCIAHRPTSW